MEMLPYYWRWGSNQLCTHSGGTDSCTTLNPLPSARTFNPFTSDVYIWGSCLYLSDTGCSAGAFYALQRNSDYAMIRVSFAQNGVAGGIEKIPGGPIKLLSTDLLLEENSGTQNRSFGMTLYYTTSLT